MPLTAISLFTGAGGLDYGFEAAGFQTRVAVEMDKDCCAALRENRAKRAAKGKRRWQVIHENIHDVSPEEILDQGGHPHRWAAVSAVL